MPNLRPALFALSITFASAGAAAAQEEPQPAAQPAVDSTAVAAPDFEREIAAARRAWVRAYESGSARRVESLIEPNAHLEANSMIYRGPSGRRNFASLIAAQEAGQVSFETAGVAPNAEGMVVDEGHYRLVARGRTFMGRYRIHWHRDEDGRWLVRTLRLSN